MKPGDCVVLVWAPRRPGRVLHERSGFVEIEWGNGQRSMEWGADLKACATDAV